MPEGEQKPSSPPRRPDVDIIRVGLTWGILLFHTVLIYSPYAQYYVKDGRSANYWGVHGVLSIAFTTMMDTWQMPMFFFLSGISAYFALFKRTEAQFRTERVHRLMVPALVLSLTAFPLSLAYFSPLTYNCQKFYEGDTFNATNFNFTVPWEHCEMFNSFTKNESFVEYMRSYFAPFPSPQQGWFLVYLFTFSQILTDWFLLFHPSHYTTQEQGHTCCGRGPSRPFSVLAKFFCCMNFLFKPSTSPQEFVSAVQWWLGTPAKLAIIPSIAIGVIEATFRTWFPNGSFHMFSVFSDVCNDLKFILIFIFGYAITAADKELKEVLKKNRWIFFISGNIILGIYSFNFMVDDYLPSPGAKIGAFIAKSLMRGFAEWIFILGTFSMCREIFKKNFSWLPLLSQIAMPFYLTHQQILTAIASGALWVPYLGSFPSVLVLTTLATLCTSYLIVKAGPVRYFFGLPPKKGSTILPGSVASGFLPLICLSSLWVLTTILVNVL